MDWKEVERAAREKFQGACRVCPRCDGRACAGEMPGIGGTGTGSSFMANFDALARVKLNMTTIHGASDPETGYEFFGLRLAMPILAAPLAGMKMNMGDPMEEREFVAAMVGGAVDAGTLAFTADGPVPLFFELGIEFLEKFGGRGVPTIKPRREETFLAMARKARDCGAPADRHGHRRGRDRPHAAGRPAGGALAGRNVGKDDLPGRAPGDPQGGHDRPGRGSWRSGPAPRGSSSPTTGGGSWTIPRGRRTCCRRSPRPSREGSGSSWTAASAAARTS